MDKVAKRKFSKPVIYAILMFLISFANSLVWMIGTNYTDTNVLTALANDLASYAINVDDEILAEVKTSDPNQNFDDVFDPSFNWQIRYRWTAATCLYRGIAYDCGDYAPYCYSGVDEGEQLTISLLESVPIEDTAYGRTSQGYLTLKYSENPLSELWKPLYDLTDIVYISEELASILAEQRGLNSQEELIGSTLKAGQMFNGSENAFEYRISAIFITDKDVPSEEIDCGANLVRSYGSNVVMVPTANITAFKGLAQYLSTSYILPNRLGGLPNLMKTIGSMLRDDKYSITYQRTPDDAIREWLLERESFVNSTFGNNPSLIYALLIYISAISFVTVVFLSFKFHRSLERKSSPFFVAFLVFLAMWGQILVVWGLFDLVGSISIGPIVAFPLMSNNLYPSLIVTLVVAIGLYIPLLSPMVKELDKNIIGQQKEEESPKPRIWRQSIKI